MGDRLIQVWLYMWNYCTGYYENVPVLLRGTFYTYIVSAMNLSSLIEDMKNYECFVIWKLSEANIIIWAWIIIASWTTILLKKNFVFFFFSSLKWSQEFAFRMVHNESIKVFYSCQFMWFFLEQDFNRSIIIEDLWYKDLQQV